MSQEQPQQEPHDDYWTDDILFADTTLSEGETLVRALVHRSEEHYGKEHRDIIPITLGPGRQTRDYIHLHPYIHVPDIRLTIGLHPRACSQNRFPRRLATMKEEPATSSRRCAYLTALIVVFKLAVVQSSGDFTKDVADCSCW